MCVREREMYIERQGEWEEEQQALGGVRPSAPATDSGAMLLTAGPQGPHSGGPRAM